MQRENVDVKMNKRSPDLSNSSHTISTEKKNLKLSAESLRNLGLTCVTVQLYEKNLLRAKIDVNEFLSMCRASGYFDLEEIYTAILETNGKLSIIPLSKHRPVTTSDLNLNPKQNYPLSNVIIDGHILKDNLRSTGNNEKWLEKQLSVHGVTNMKEVMLATCDIGSNQLNIYVKLHEKTSRDLFE